MCDKWIYYGFRWPADLPLLLSCIVVVDLIQNYKELFQHQAMWLCLDPQLRTGQNCGGRMTVM